jgi:hypothetical protein
VKSKFRFLRIITLTAAIGFALTALSLAGCADSGDDGSGSTTGGGNKTPVATDYTIGNTTQTANEVIYTS